MQQSNKPMIDWLIDWVQFVIRRVTRPSAVDDHIKPTLFQVKVADELMKILSGKINYNILWFISTPQNGDFLTLNYRWKSYKAQLEQNNVWELPEERLEDSSSAAECRNRHDKLLTFTATAHTDMWQTCWFYVHWQSNNQHRIVYNKRDHHLCCACRILSYQQFLQYFQLQA